MAGRILSPLQALAFGTLGYLHQPGSDFSLLHNWHSECTDRSCIFCPNDICLNCSKNMYKYLYEDHRCYPICNESNGHFATVRANDFYYCNSKI